MPPRPVVRLQRPASGSPDSRVGSVARTDLLRPTLPQADAGGGGVSRAGAPRPCLPEPDAAEDLLQSGDQPTPWRRRATLLALLVVGALSVTGDQLQRSREVDALLDRAEAGRDAVIYADRRVTSTIRYSSPALTSARVPQRVRTSLEDLVEQAAGERVADVLGERDAAAGLHVLPWHGDQRAARDRWVGYLDARVARLRAVADDFDALYTPDPMAEQGLAVVRDAYVAAAPASRPRIDAAFDLFR